MAVPGKDATHSVMVHLKHLEPREADWIRNILHRLDYLCLLPEESWDSLQQTNVTLSRKELVLVVNGCEANGLPRWIGRLGLGFTSPVSVHMYTVMSEIVRLSVVWI